MGNREAEVLACHEKQEPSRAIVIPGMALASEAGLLNRRGEGGFGTCESRGGVNESEELSICD